MKKLYIIAALALSILSSCTEPPLDRYPKDTLNDETFWTNEDDARMALNGCYNYLNSAYYNVYDDANTDNAFSQYPWESTASDISSGNITSGTTKNSYGGGYGYLRTINTFLEKVQPIPMDENLKKRFISEARVIRAMVYFDLINTYGDVPFITEVLKNPMDAAKATTPEMDIYKFVIDELTQASANLPTSYGGGKNNETGRLTKGAAIAMKARVALFYGKWDVAAAAAKEVMDSGTYSLFRGGSATDQADDFSAFVDFADDADRAKFYKGLNSYEQLFWGANKGNSEGIIVSQSIDNSKIEGWATWLNTMLTCADLNGWSSITPTVEMVNAYWNREGKPFAAPTAQERATLYNGGNDIDPAYFNEFKNRDTRLYASILFPSATMNKAIVDGGYQFFWTEGGNMSKIGYNFRKLTDPKYINLGLDSDQEFPILRYAEVLLTYAEAKNELSGPDASIYDAIDEIRDRVAMPAVDRNEYNTKEKLRALIRNERRIELVLEGQRYLDIRRWNIGADVMKDIYDINNNIAQNRVWQARFVRLPYPQGAVDHNANLKAAQAAKGY